LTADVPLPPNAGKAESPNLQSFVKQQFSGTPPDQQKGNITLFNYVSHWEYKYEYF
jgi:hypothetical protein